MTNSKAKIWKNLDIPKQHSFGISKCKHQIYFAWTKLTISNNIVPGIIMPSSRSRLNTVFLNTAYMQNYITSGHNNKNLL